MRGKVRVRERYLVVIDVEIKMVMRVNVNVMFMWKEIRFFHLTEKTANGNVFHYEFEVVEFFDGQSQGIDIVTGRFKRTKIFLLKIL